MISPINRSCTPGCQPKAFTDSDKQGEKLFNGIILILFGTQFPFIKINVNILCLTKNSQPKKCTTGTSA